MSRRQRVSKQFLKQAPSVDYRHKSLLNIKLIDMETILEMKLSRYVPQ